MEDEVKARIASSQIGVVQEIGQRIKERRIAKDMSQAVLAQKLGLTRAAVTQWESGQATCNYAQALELEKVLDVDVCFLIFGRSQEAFEDDILGAAELSDDVVSAAA
ncbi:helix-turn-helix transcriptional regulator [Rhizobium leguminosarum]|uniref:helix-turn-helix domain-containing protein n=1 Tax=Rhizobium leguminosarum TaxID=384 RepID=UPI002E0E0069|nr:helix-turn-helix transcriptional regulator [Rhizobium leguminosarum]